MGVFGQYLTFIDEFCSFLVITGEKLVTNCNFRPYIWIFWCFQPVSGELRPFQWSSGRIGSFLGKFRWFWAVFLRSKGLYMDHTAEVYP